MPDRRFKPTEAHKLEDPERLIWLPPSEVVAHLDPRPGLVVVDMGAGTGYFAIPIAKAIAPTGKVLAVDVEPEMLEKLKVKLAANESPKNIELHQGEATATQLPDHLADRVLIANVWHELDPSRWPAAAQEAARLLRSHGKLIILDWRPDVDRPPGPPLEHRIPIDQVAAFLISQGWKVEESCLIGRYSYLLIAVPDFP